MASIFRIMGLLAGHAMKNQAINVAVNTASKIVNREMRLTDIRLKLRLLKRKRDHHIKLLGRTIYRLSINHCESLDTENTRTITRVITEIDCEIKAARDELERRKAEEQETRARTTP